MGQGADRDDVHARLGDAAHRRQIDSARGLQHDPPCDARHGGAQGVEAEIVQHDDIGRRALVDQGQYGVQLIQPIDLDLDLHQMRGESLGPPHRLGDAAADGDVVVLDQDGVIQTEAVVDPAAAGHGVLLQRAQPRRGLARIRYPRLGPGDGLDVGARQGRHAA